MSLRPAFWSQLLEVSFAAEHRIQDSSRVTRNIQGVANRTAHQRHQFRCAITRSGATDELAHSEDVTCVSLSKARDVNDPWII